ncbi:hypothetical protein NP493_340g03053 [Ridgeia piscesae]|uniref:RNase NYN domain-containing protein n=1 Tax=Ridgeia piscesae TaxID=27915 RepID=A0AAD9NVN0_RIDPI|nr:hypothetical protein NP493_340g03053 [Ridgeia piscesae]
MAMGRYSPCKGIQLCVDYFRQRGHTEITAFVPQWRTQTAIRPDYPISDQHLLNKLKAEGVLVFTPSRRVQGKNIVCYDDRFHLRLATTTEGVIVSNDNFRDLWNDVVAWRDVIEKRQHRRGTGPDKIGEQRVRRGTGPDKIGEQRVRRGTGSDKIGEQRVRRGTGSDKIGEQRVRRGTGSDKIGEQRVRRGTGSDKIGEQRVRRGTGSDKIGEQRVRRGTGSGNIGVHRSGEHRVRHGSWPCDLITRVASKAGDLVSTRSSTAMG